MNVKALHTAPRPVTRTFGDAANGTAEFTLSANARVKCTDTMVTRQPVIATLDEHGIARLSLFPNSVLLPTTHYDVTIYDQHKHLLRSEQVTIGWWNLNG